MANASEGRVTERRDQRPKDMVAAVIGCASRTGSGLKLTDCFLAQREDDDGQRDALPRGKCLSQICHPVGGSNEPISELSGIVPKHWSIVADAVKRRRYPQPRHSGSFRWLPAGCLGTEVHGDWFNLKDTPSVWGTGMACGSGGSAFGCSIVFVVFHREDQ
ncbi:hypothetical protein KXV64_008772, partial [Aspergillus fumigatus]